MSLVTEVVAVDLLFNHDRLDMEAIFGSWRQTFPDWPVGGLQVGEAFRRSVYDPAWKRLRPDENLYGRQIRRVSLDYIGLFIEQSRTRKQLALREEVAGVAASVAFHTSPACCGAGTTLILAHLKRVHQQSGNPSCGRSMAHQS